MHLDAELVLVISLVADQARLIVRVAQAHLINPIRESLRLASADCC